MRLSDAIAVGRTLVKNCVAGGSTRDNAKPGDGCVLDMAALAVGKKHWVEAECVWTWLKNRVPDPDSKRNYEEEIYERFDGRVCLDKDMTLDQLIDWIRSVEPEETPTTELSGAVAESEASTAVVTKGCR